MLMEYWSKFSFSWDDGKLIPQSDGDTAVKEEEKDVSPGIHHRSQSLRRAREKFKAHGRAHTHGLEQILILIFFG